jgi:uncharacterized protein HemX
MEEDMQNEAAAEEPVAAAPPEASPPEAPKMPSGRSRHAWRWIGIAALIVAVGVGAFFLGHWAWSNRHHRGRQHFDHRRQHRRHPGSR